jgi:hypothetical protein
VRLDTRRSRALALAALLLAAPAAAQSPWSAELAAGYGSGVGGDFGGSGSVGLHAAGLYRLSRTLSTGIELGWYRLGTLTTLVPDLYGPGSTYQEDFGWSALQATATLRLHPTRGPWQPYAALGTGAYGARSRDVIVVTDAAGRPLPNLAFHETRTDLKLGANLGLGIVRRGAFGKLALGVHARWHTILDAGGTADFATVTVGVGLD